MLRFAPCELTDAELALQAEVREFLAAELPRGSFAPGLGMAAARDQGFSRALAARGWLGMALPRRYGGAERGVVDRFIVVEELLRWGAPVRYHWVADRQTGPLILRYGSAAQRERFLPAICRGEVSFSIGMSEPDAGSDLAGVQTRATRADGGWCCERNEALDRRRPRERLVRRAVSHERRGGSPPRADAADRRPARAGHHGAADRLPGRQRVLQRSRPRSRCSSPTSSSSATWARAGSRTPPSWPSSAPGPERWLSTYLVRRAVPARARRPFTSARRRCWARRSPAGGGFAALSLSVARLLDAGEAPAAESALVKELGTRFEQDVLDAVWRLVPDDPDPSRGFAVRAAARGGDPGRPVVHDPRRDQRDPALRRGEGAARMTVESPSATVRALARLRERGPDRAAEVALLGEWLLARAGLGAV